MWTIILVIVLLGLLYWKLKQPHYYWTKLGVKQEDPLFLVGNIAGTLFKRTPFNETIKRIYNAHPDEKYVGSYLFLQPTLVIRDPDLLKQIMVKEFDSFVDHNEIIPPGIDEMWSRGIFALKGERWRDMRSTLSPAFTSSKMRGMFTLISDCSEQFVQFFLNKKEDQITLETEDIFTRFANDCIATCAFGFECNSLNEPNNEFYLLGKETTDLSSLPRTMGIFLYKIVPTLMRACGVSMITKNVRRYFSDIVTDAIKIREKNNIIRPDMIHLLTEARKGRLHYTEDEKTSKEAGFATAVESNFTTIEKSKRLEITEMDIIAQAMIFFFAGFETTSIMMSMMAYELAVNQDIQDRLIKEIDNHLQDTDGKITYEGINKLKYLDMVLSEVLRKWPPLPSTDRVAVKPFTIEPSLPSEKPLHIPTGTICWIPIYGLQHDPKYYPNPSKFDPERFNEENRSKINQYAYTTFGGGPRNCLGSRFALMEGKTVYVHILKYFRFVPIERTEIPFKVGTAQFNIHPANGNWLGLQRRK